MLATGLTFYKTLNRLSLNFPTICRGLFLKKTETKARIVRVKYKSN